MGSTGELVAVLTDILDPGDARAEEIASVYHQRWEETANDQLKTHLRGPGPAVTAAGPGLPRDLGLPDRHHAICALIAKASAAADLDPDRVSFAKALRRIRRTATGTADIFP